MKGKKTLAQIIKFAVLEKESPFRFLFVQRRFKYRIDRRFSIRYREVVVLVKGRHDYRMPPKWTISRPSWRHSLSQMVVSNNVFRQKKVLTRVSICVSMLVFGQIRVGLEFALHVSTILGYNYQALTWLRLQSFGIRLDNEPRVGTPLRGYLVKNHSRTKFQKMFSFLCFLFLM